MTGLYSAWAQVTVIQALSTPYGWTLVVKIGIVALLLLGSRRQSGLGQAEAQLRRTRRVTG